MNTKNSTGSGAGMSGCRLHHPSFDDRCMGCLIRSAVDPSWLEAIGRVRDELQREALVGDDEVVGGRTVIDLRSTGAGSAVARQDPSTLLDRSGLVASVDELLAASSVAVLWVDLNDLPHVEATFGEDAATFVKLRCLGRLAMLGSASRAVSTGSTSLGVAVQVRDLEEVGSVTSRAVQLLTAPVDLEGTPLLADPRFGVAVGPLHGCDSATLVERARGAALVAEQTHTAFAVWDPDAAAEVTRRLVALGQLADVVGESTPVLAFQPMVDGTGAFCGAEVQSSWNLPGGGQLRPVDYASIVEGSMLEHSLLRATLVAAAREWRSIIQLAPHARLTINLSAGMLATSSSTATISSALVEAGASPEHLQVEIDARAADLDIPNLREQIVGLRSLGVRVVLDHFGVGRSSIDLLRRLPLDGVKIDRMFVRHIDTDLVSQAIVAGCVDVANALGLTVCVAGVETERELQALCRCGADGVQGYAISRALDLDGLASFVGRRLSSRTPVGSRPRR